MQDVPIAGLAKPYTSTALKARLFIEALIATQETMLRQKYSTYCTKEKLVGYTWLKL